MKSLKYFIKDIITKEKLIMTELEELEDILGSLKYIEPFGVEPDLSSLGLEPAEVFGFTNEKELENALKKLTIDVNQNQRCINETYKKLI